MVGILVQVDNKLVEKGALLHSDCEAGDASGQMRDPTGPVARTATIPFSVNRRARVRRLLTRP